jgi:KaiC/GvpD/RAD55 family RecA-like ATPase
MAARIVYHVLPGPGGWQVRRGHGKRSSAVHARKPAAIRAAVVMAKNHPRAQVVIHAADGTISSDRTYDGQALRRKRKVRKVVRKMLRTKKRKAAKRRAAARKGVKTRKRRQRKIAIRRSSAAKRGASRRRRR